MKRIDGTDVWTDGVVKYKKNEMGDFAIYIEETVNVVSEDNIVELEEPVILKPVDSEE